MRKTVKAIISVAICVAAILGNTTAQSDSTETPRRPKIQLGLATDMPIRLDGYFNDGFYINTMATATIGRHVALLGPVWWLDKNEDVNVFQGFSGSYRFFPFNVDGRFALFCAYDMLYTKKRSSWRRNMQLDPHGQYDVDYNATWRSFRNQLGYGASLKLVNGLYLDQSISVGVEFYDYNSETSVAEKPELSSTYTTGGIFDGSRTSAFAKIGIRYVFVEL